MKVYLKETGKEVKNVIVEYDTAGKPVFVRSKNDDRDPDRQPIELFDIRGVDRAKAGEDKTVIDIVTK